jgi:hypothetical protein
LVNPPVVLIPSCEFVGTLIVFMALSVGIHILYRLERFWGVLLLFVLSVIFHCKLALLVAGWSLGFLGLGFLRSGDRCRC